MMPPVMQERHAPSRPFRLGTRRRRAASGRGLGAGGLALALFASPFT